MKAIVKKGDKLIREYSLMRAGCRCELCNTDRDDLDSHHLLPKSVYPQHRHNPNNIAILCRRECHIMAEDHPEEFAEQAAESGRFADRLQWADDHRDTDKYPTEVDYEENVRMLREAV